MDRNESEIFDRPLPSAPLPFTGERLTSAIAGKTEIEHWHRYLYARELCRGKDVVDVACGEGYGSACVQLLSYHFKDVSSLSNAR
jgi:hypothetical protein